MQNLVLVLVGAWIGVGGSAMMPHFSWVIWGLCGIPIALLWLYSVKLQRTADRRQAERDEDNENRKGVFR